MSPNHKLFFIALFVLLIAATLQSGELITFLGVKPNLVLVLLAAFSFFIPRFFPYALLSLFGATVLSFAPGVSWEAGALLLVTLFFFYVRDRFLSAGLLASILFSVFGTIAFYLLISPPVLYHEVTVIMKELFYNAALGALFFSLTGFFYEKKGGSSIR
jgi:hypothetical protein